MAGGKSQRKRTRSWLEGSNTHRDGSDRVAELDGSVDKKRVGLVVLEVFGTDAHALADGLAAGGELGGEEVGEIVRLGPLLAQKVLRSKRGGPVDCGGPSIN